MFGDFGSHLGVAAIGGPIGNRATMLRALRQAPTPGAKPPHTTIPAAVTDDGGGLRYVLGVAGGFMQPQAQVQLLVRMLGEGMAPQEAIDAPRFKVLFGGEVALEPGHPLLAADARGRSAASRSGGFRWRPGRRLARRPAGGGGRCPSGWRRRGPGVTVRALAGPPKFFGLAVLRSGEILGATFAAGVVRSGPGAWSAVPELSELSTNAVLQTTSGAVLVGTNGNGLHRSPDGGRSWQRVAAGPAGTVYSLAEGRSLYAGTADEGMWQSMDDGANWTPVDRGRSGTCIYAVTARRDGTVVAGTDLARVTVHALADDGSAMYAGCNGDGVLRSSDGECWAPASTGLGDPHVHCLLVTTDRTLLAGTGAGVFRTRDGGATWSAANTGMGASRIFSLAAASDGSLFAGGYDGVWRSTDGAASWSPVPTGLTAAHVFAVAAAGGAVYGGTGDGLVRSGDGGRIVGASRHGPRRTHRLLRCVHVRRPGARRHLGWLPGVHGHGRDVAGGERWADEPRRLWLGGGR